jgi:hypothetical protein
VDLNITDFGAAPDRQNDTTPAVLAALDRCRGKDRCRIVFPTGRYQFYRDRCGERLLYTSNNDGGIKRIGMPLMGLRNIELDGQGSRFIFHGRMIPVAVWDSGNVMLRNFSVDWDRPFTLEAEVVDQKPGHVDLKMSAATPYVIRDGRLSGLDDDCYPQTQITFIEFDPRRQEFAYDTPYPSGRNRAVEIEPGLVRVSGLGEPLRVGRTVCMRMELRHSPALSIGRSAEVQVVNVALHAAAGMGVIAQESRDIRLDNLRVTPTPDSGRILSVQDDATHFCNCRGQIVMENCLLERCWDDGGNVHGTYRVINMRGPNWTVTQTGHFQQMGVGMGQQDDDLFEFIDPATMKTLHQDRGFDYKVYNAHQTAITYRHPLPDSIKLGMAIENVSATPDLTIRRCTFRNTRPRGVLINTRGKVVVEDNFFHVLEGAVVIGADVNSWYESGAVKDVLIRRNTFDNCGYLRPSGTPAPITVAPVVSDAGRGSPFERNIRIEENTFRAFDPLLVHARSVDGLTFRNNVIESNTDYPRVSKQPGPLDVDDCVNVTVEGNQTKGPR